MSHVTIQGTLASAVAASGTLAVSYPARPGPDYGSYNEGDFFNSSEHKLVMGQGVLTYPNGFGIALDATNITLTNPAGAATWPAGSKWILELQMPGKALYRSTGKTVHRTSRLDSVMVNLGAPDTLDVDGICETQNRTGAGALLINGALSDGDLATSVATLDVPRNVIVDSGGADTAVITITGKDEYGNTMSEAITLNGTTAVAGKKAFKTITSVVASTTVANTAFIGTGDVIGLPLFLPNLGMIEKEMENGTAATAGTTVVGIRTASTTTTGDVRGTYDPNSACDGEKVFQLQLSLPDPTYLGVAQA